MSFIRRISCMNKCVYFGFRSVAQPPNASFLENIYHGNPVHYCTYKNRLNAYTGISIKKNVYIPERNLSRSKSVATQLSLRNSKTLVEDCPKALLNSIYNTINSKLKLSNSMNKTFHVDENGNWKCKISVSWPEKCEFEEFGNNKKIAHKLAALKCLRWLEENNKLKHGKPIVYSTNDIENFMNKVEEVKVDPGFVTRMEELVQSYSDVKNLMKPMVLEMETPITASQELDESLKRDKIIKDFNYRDREMRRKLFTRPHSQKSFPIEGYKLEIIKKLEHHRKLLIKGDTGCGKTTQVPQIILDYFTAKNQCTACNILISQPRRISAISNARFVALQRREKIGDSVGYKVRLAQVTPWTPGGILFCSTGILLLMLQKSPNLHNYTHVILDEAHERTVETDMLLVLLKRAVDLNPRLRLVVMSATMNSDLLQKYLDCPIIEVPGKIYPVQMNFLEDIKNLGINTYRPSTPELNDGTFVNDRGMCDLINYIVDTTQEGAILCFLPGWMDISRLRWYLETGAKANELMIAPLHSKLSHLDQEKVFEHPPPGLRKVILATDIAENGITIDDVTHVVDCAVHKAQRWDVSKNVFSVSHGWVTKANINQRKGRAGRVRPGVSYHFITKEQYDTLEEYPTPEILSIPLDKILLQAKIHSTEKAATFFSNTLQSPSPELLQTAIESLQKLGALDHNENLTQFGRNISKFWLYPTLGKSIVLSSIFKCVLPVLTIISMYSIDHNVFARSLEDKAGQRKLKKKYHPTSDHVAMSWLFTQWCQYFIGNSVLAEDFCNANKITRSKMEYLKKIISLNAEGLVASHLARSSDECIDPQTDLNSFASLDELVKGVLLAGMDQVLYQPGYTQKRGDLVESFGTLLADDNTRTLISNESVNYKRKSWPSPYLTYLIRTFNTNQRMAVVRETSMISSLTLILFTQSEVRIEKSIETNGKKQCILRIDGKNQIKLTCDTEVAEILIQFRQVLWDVVNYLAGCPYTEVLFHDKLLHIKEFQDKVLLLVAEMLYKSSTGLDIPETEISSNAEHGQKS